MTGPPWPTWSGNEARLLTNYPRFCPHGLDISRQFTAHLFRPWIPNCALPTLPVCARTVSGYVNSAFLNISIHFTAHLFRPWIPNSKRCQYFCPRSERFVCLNSAFSRHFYTFYGPSVQAIDTQLNALPTEPGGAHQFVLHPRKREHRVPEKTEDHDVSPDQKLRSGSQSRSSREILPPPRHDSGTGVVAGVEIPAGCPAVAAMVLDQQEGQEQHSNGGAEKDDIAGPQGML